MRKKILKMITTCLFTACFSIFILITLWAVLFKAPFTAMLLIFMAFLFFPYINQIKFVKIIKSTLIIIIPASIMLTFKIPVMEINNRIHELSLKPRKKETLAQFNMVDKLGIYGLNLAMGICGFPFYPEASIETICLIAPPDKSGKRIFYSDFPLKSEKVRNAVKKLIDHFDIQTNAVYVDFNPVEIAWTAETDYAFGNKEARAALALNKAILRARAVKENGRWMLSAGLSVECRYPQNSNFRLIKNPELNMEEGLFWVLQEAGWLYPYEAVWMFKMPL